MVGTSDRSGRHMTPFVRLDLARRRPGTSSSRDTIRTPGPGYLRRSAAAGRTRRRRSVSKVSTWSCATLPSTPADDAVGCASTASTRDDRRRSGRTRPQDSIFGSWRSEDGLTPKHRQLQRMTPAEFRDGCSWSDGTRISAARPPRCRRRTGHPIPSPGTERARHGDTDAAWRP